MRNVVLKFSFALAMVVLAACGGGDSDFSGTFIGTETSQGTQNRATVTLSQSGTNISGTFTSTPVSGGQAVSGQLAGVTKGNTVTQLTLTSSGGICPSMTGTASQANRVITGTLNCVGGQGGTITFQVTRQQQ